MLVPHAECGRGRIGEPDLYERLFSMFARREVSTDDEDRTDADLAEDTETELKRLSVVAFAPNQLSRSDKPIVAPESSASPGGPVQRGEYRILLCPQRFHRLGIAVQAWHHTIPAYSASIRCGWPTAVDYWYWAPTVTTQAYSWHRAVDVLPLPTHGPYATYRSPLFSSQRTVTLALVTPVHLAQPDPPVCPMAPPAWQLTAAWAGEAGDTSTSPAAAATAAAAEPILLRMSICPSLVLYVAVSWKSRLPNRPSGLSRGRLSVAATHP